MAKSLDTLAAQLLDAASGAGADAADALVVNGTSLSIDVLNGRLEHAERAEGIDLGLRVLVGQRQACVSSSDGSDETIAAMAERAVAMAREAPDDATIGLADTAQLASAWDLAALDLADPAPEPAPHLLEEEAKRAEAAALAVTGVSMVESASTAYSHRSLHLAASNGFSGGYTRTSRGMTVAAIAETDAGKEVDWSHESRVYQADLPSPDHIGREAGERAVANTNAKQPPTGAFPVLFDERVSSSLIGHLLMAINGAAIARGSSWLRDALGDQVLPSALSLIEDPHRARISGSRPFDAEGLPTTRRAIVENGVLMGWTLDLATARKLGLDSTANATRGTTAPPSPGISNIALTQSQLSRGELIAQMGTGLIITSLIGSTINPTTGDYSRGASGFWVENGTVTGPVNECTIAGNLRDMLMRLTPANDAKTHHSRMVPSLLVEGLTLAGN